MVSDSDDTADHTNDPSSPHCAQTFTFSYFFFHLDIIDFSHAKTYSTLQLFKLDGGKNSFSSAIGWDFANSCAFIVVWSLDF